jgi:L-2-hydroxyglutarate oxidase LhgO
MRDRVFPGKAFPGKRIAMIEVDFTIVGAGVVGLAIARELGTGAGQTVVLERESGPGMGVSSRNSEVIHAGIYYPTGSLKAGLCVRGAGLLYQFCSRFGVPCSRVGKVIVASAPEEERAVEDLLRQGTENGVEGLVLMGRTELLEREPHVSGECALFSRNTGIIDTHRLMKTFEAYCLGQGVSILYRTALCGIGKTPSGFVCRAQGPDGDVYEFSSRVVINSAGLDCGRVAGLAGIDADRAGYRVYPVKGEYFRVGRGKGCLVNGLVYPVPEISLTGLGIHATKDLSGSLRLGPNTLPVESLDYDVDPSHAQAFFESARRLLPFLEPEDLSPDMAGIRPKIQKPGEGVKDFVISHETGIGLEGLVTLAGIESPGLTSCLAIGEYVEKLLKEAGLMG